MISFFLFPSFSFFEWFFSLLSIYTHIRPVKGMHLSAFLAYDDVPHSATDDASDKMTKVFFFLLLRRTCFFFGLPWSSRVTNGADKWKMAAFSLPYLSFLAPFSLFL